MADTQDTLLDELAGAAVMTNVDVLPPTKEPNPLEVLPPAKQTRIKASDAKHSTAAGGKGYRVKMTGEYFAQSAESSAKLKKQYELEFNVPSLDGVMGVIVGKLLLPALKRKYADCVNYRTHDIVSAVPLGPTTPESKNLQFMPRAALEAHVEEYGVPLDPAHYPEVTDLRDAVIDFTLNPTGFEEREARKQADRKETAELKAMNPELLGDAPANEP